MTAATTLCGCGGSVAGTLGSRESKVLETDSAAYAMHDFIRSFAHAEKRTPVTRLGGGLLISALLHLALIVSMGPIVASPLPPLEQQQPGELTVWIAATPSATERSRKAPLTREPVRPAPVSVPVPAAPLYFENHEVDVPARIINDVILHYPPTAYQQRISGEVKLRLYISQAGEVDEAEVIAAEPTEIFDAAAVNAAKQLRYSPARKDGSAVKTTKTIAITFDPTNRPL